MSKMVQVRFNETTLLGARVFGHGEEHIISQAEADRLGTSLVVLGDANNDFPVYDKSVYGDNQAAKERDPQDPSELEPVSVGESDVEARREVVSEGEKDITAPENKMVGKVPVKK